MIIFFAMTIGLKSCLKALSEHQKYANLLEILESQEKDRYLMKEILTSMEVL